MTRFRKEPVFKGARLPVAAPAEASKRRGPAPRGIPADAGVNSAEGRAVLEDGWLSPCAVSLPPHRLSVPPHPQLRPLSAAPSHRMTCSPSVTRAPTTLRPGRTWVVVASAPGAGSRQQASERRTSKSLCPGMSSGPGSREEAAHTPSADASSGRGGSRAVTSPGPRGPAPPHGPPREPAPRKTAQC